MTLWSALLIAIWLFPFSTPREERSFEFTGLAKPRIVIQNDLGDIQVRGGGSASQVRVTVSHTVPAGRTPAELFLNVEERDGGVVVSVFFSVQPPWPVDVRIEAPASSAVAISGRRPQVRVEGVEETLRVQTGSGEIRVENASGSATLATDSGGIEYIPRSQPRGDVHLSSASGEIRCRIPQGLRLNVVLRSDSISWGTETQTSQGGLRRELGGGGPLLSASSDAGPIVVSLQQPVVAGGDPLADRGPAVPSSTVIRVAVNWVYLNVSVTDPVRDTSLTDLVKDDFVVYENGTVQPLGHFESIEAPFHLLLLLDMSESTRPHLSLIRSGALRFAAQIRPQDKLAIAEFNEGMRRLQDFTSSREKISQAVGRLSPTGGTAVYDALAEALTEHMARVEGRKAIVLFSDGEDNSLFATPVSGSRRPFESLLRKVQESDCLVYPIYLTRQAPQKTSASSAARANPGSIVGRLARINERYSQPMCVSELDASVVVPCPADLQDTWAMAENHMRALAAQTGGRLYRPRRIEDLEDAYAEVANELRTRYTLGYESRPSPQGEWRTLRVKIAGHPLAVVRTRAGYYAPKSQP